MSRPLVTHEMKPKFDEWVVDILKPLYSTEPGILGDYIFALLVKKTDSIAQLKELCLAELSDFLGEHTQPFVELLFSKLQKGFHDSSKPPSHAAGSRHASAAPSQPPSHPLRKRSSPDRGASPPRSGAYEPSRSRSSRSEDERRPYYPEADRYRERPRDDYYSSSSSSSSHRRQEEYPKRQRTSDYESSRSHRHDSPPHSSSHSSSSSSHGHPPSHHSSHSSHSHPSSHSHSSSSSSHSSSSSSSERRHRHGEPPSPPHAEPAPLLPAELDPPKLTTICVEHIPDAQNTVSSLMSQFGSFGTIIAANAKPSRQKAYIQFATAKQAEAALNSPEAIFNNRFITISMASAGRGARPFHPDDAAAPSARGAPFAPRGGRGRGAAPPALPSQLTLSIVTHPNAHPAAIQPPAAAPAAAPVARPAIPSRFQLSMKKEEQQEQQGEPSAQASGQVQSQQAVQSTTDFVKKQFDLQSEILRLLRKPGLSEQMKAQLKEQLKKVAETLEQIAAKPPAAAQAVAASPAAAASQASEAQAEAEQGQGRGQDQLVVLIHDEHDDEDAHHLEEADQAHVDAHDPPESHAQDTEDHLEPVAENPSLPTSSNTDTDDVSPSDHQEPMTDL